MGSVARFTQFAQPALVNGEVGVVVASAGRAYAVVGFTVRRGQIVEIDILADPIRLRRLDLAVFLYRGQATASPGR